MPRLREHSRHIVTNETGGAGEQYVHGKIPFELMLGSSVWRFAGKHASGLIETKYISVAER
jgi:hypothetical protein